MSFRLIFFLGILKLKDLVIADHMRGMLTAMIAYDGCLDNHGSTVGVKKKFPYRTVSLTCFERT